MHLNAMNDMCCISFYAFYFMNYIPLFILHALYLKRMIQCIEYNPLNSIHEQYSSNTRTNCMIKAHAGISDSVIKEIETSWG